MEPRKKINLYFDFEFTSLSPDAQPISLGIVSDEYWQEEKSISPREYEERKEKGIDVSFFELVQANNGNWNAYYQPVPVPVPLKSFYAEFSDFDLNRCDEWVKENVVGKLLIKNTQGKNGGNLDNNNNPTIVGNTEWIKSHLLNWITQFQEYDIQFICDCGTFDFYHLLQLIGEWETKTIRDVKLPENIEDFNMGNTKVDMYIKIGLPKLSENISPIPQDLNDMIALKKEISAKEAFDLNREELAFSESFMPLKKAESAKYMQGEEWGDEKHNSLWDAKVIKEIYNKLNQ